MIIDDNELEKRAMASFRTGDEKNGHRLQNQFLSEVRQSGMDHCTCTSKCPHHGKCADCVVIHRGHQDHLPNCFHEMVNRRIATMAGLTEHMLAKA
jgi:lysine/ornithine N-monooxygenase